MSAMVDDRAFRERLMLIFWREAGGHLTVLQHFAELSPPIALATRQDAFEAAFRAVHSLRGAARAVNEGDVEMLCLGIETSLSRGLRGEQEWLAAVHDDVRAAIGKLASACAALRPGGRDG